MNHGVFVFAAYMVAATSLGFISLYALLRLRSSCVRLRREQQLTGYKT